MRRFLVLLALFAASSRLAAQVGVSTDIITGTVTDQDGAPLQGATVEVMSLESRVLRSATTDVRGRYRVLFPDGGGRYQIYVRSLGYAGVRLAGQRRSEDDDRIQVDAKLTGQPVEVEALMVRGNGALRAPAPTPGSTEVVQTPDRLARLPIDASDFNAIAALAAGVVSVAGTDSSVASFSVAGQGPTGNATTLDGLGLGAASVPQDAVRGTRIVTNTYDVARGQFTGGLVSSTTRSGSNVVQGTGNGTLRDPTLAWDGEDPTRQTGAVQQFSMGIGGPIRTNKLFYFLSGQVRHRDDRLLSASTLDPSGAERFGLAPDSLDRFIGIVSGFGVPVDAPGAPDSRFGRDLSALVRADWVVSQAHTLSLRGDWRRSDQDPTRVSSLGTSASGGEQESDGGGVMLTLSSRLGQSVINELKAYASGSSNQAIGYLHLPQGRVQVSSELSDGSTSFSTLSFGGSTGLPQEGSTSSLEVTNEASWLPGDARHRFKFGVFYTTTESRQGSGANQFGTFTFNSLSALEAGTPSTFTRTLAPATRKGRASTGALYVGDVWRPIQAVQLTLGARAEQWWFGGAGVYDAMIDSLFGLRTDRLPEETRVSPRLGFSWSGLATDGPARLTVRGGVGEFRSPIPQQLAASAAATVGGAAETQLFCAGPSAPTPDWSAYLLDPTSIPDSCSGPPSPSSSGAPTYTIFGHGVEAPRALRSSLGIQYRSGLVGYGLEVSHATGSAQSGFIDRNLGAPQFTLAGEGGRQVFAPLSAIDTATGAVALGDSRLDPTYGQVLEITSRYRNRSTAIAASASGIIGHGITFTTSYTWSKSDNQVSAVSGGGRGGSAGVDPTIQEYAPSDFDRRHQLVGTLYFPLGKGFELTSIGRLTSGMPFTPSVAGDVNADGARNDRAFIPDPATADPALAAAMTDLMAGASRSVRDCLEGQLGKVAARNSCRGPWQPSLDLQLNYKPRILEQRLTISRVTSNFLAGVDRLVHGQDDMHGWGQFTRPDATLLTVRGFDAGTSSYRYEVNERFGGISGTNGALVVPFQLGIQLRYVIGPTGPAAFFAGGPGGAGRDGGGGFRVGAPGAAAPGATPGAAAGTGGAANPLAAFADRFARLMPDPIAAIQEKAVLVHLTEDQSARLDSISRRFVTARDSLSGVIREDIQRAGPNPDPAVLFSGIRPKMEAGRHLSEAALEEARGVLTPEQWAQLPPEVKEPPRGFGPGPGGRRPGQ